MSCVQRQVEYDERESPSSSMMHTILYKREVEEQTIKYVTLQTLGCGVGLNSSLKSIK